MPKNVSITNLILYGLAAFGAFKAYEASPFTLDSARGQRGSLQEAMLWEMGGHPPGTRMMPGRRNPRR